MATITPRKSAGENRTGPVPKRKAAYKPNVDAALRAPVTKTTDSKGRVLLGGGFANQTVIVEHVSETEMLVKLARVIPEREAWLYENPTALAAVRKGLGQARAGDLVEGPNLEVDSKLASRLKD